jgi:general secretion pathway protein L
VLLLLLVLGQWRHNREQALATMQAQVEAMRGEAQQVSTLRQQLQDNAGAAGFLVQRKERSVTMLSVLQELTERLPDSAWIERLSVDNTGQIGFQGQSKRAVQLVDALKDSKLIRDANFQGSIQPDPATGKDRFYMVAQLREPVATAAPAAARSAGAGR